MKTLLIQFLPLLAAVAMIVFASVLNQFANVWHDCFRGPLARNLPALAAFYARQERRAAGLFANPTFGALSDFIPNIWTARFLMNLEENLVWGSLVNRNYEGEISAYGDTVKIPEMTSDITLADYAENTDIADPELVNGSTRDFTIDRQRYFNLYVDDVNRAQSRPDLMSEAMRKAGIRTAYDVDTYIAGKFVKSLAGTRRVEAADNTGAKQLQGVIDLKKMMTEAKIPLGGRWLVVPPTFIARLESYLLTNPTAALFTPATADEAMRNGYAGMLMGFRLLVSNRVPDEDSTEANPFGGLDNPDGRGGATSYECIAGQGNDVVTFAQQIAQIEAYRPEKRFGDAVKGLYVYGADRITPYDKRIFALRLPQA